MQCEAGADASFAPPLSPPLSPLSQLPGVYKVEEIPRVPIICTGNDFSTLYAPLIRDGRMDKYYWNPTREDRVGVCVGIFQVRPTSGIVA